MAGNSSIAHRARRRGARPTPTAIGAAGGGGGPRLRRRRAVLPRRARGRERRASRRRRRRRRPSTRRAARYPDGASLAEVQYDPAPDRRHGHRRARRPGCSCARRPRSATPATPSALVAIMEAKVAATETAADGHRSARSRSTGGQGYTPALPIERHLRDARAGAVMAPDQRACCATGSARPSPAFRCHERRRDAMLVGAVAYHPRIVTIWEALPRVLRERGRADRLRPLLELRAARSTRCSPARSTSRWNTNTAYVAAEQRIGGDAQILGMRDVDADFRDGDRRRAAARRSRTSRALAGQRLALGSRDSGHAAILPLHYLAQRGARRASDCELVRFDTDLGKHGDTGDSELRVVRGGRARATPTPARSATPTWAALRARGPARSSGARGGAGAARPTTTATSPRCRRSTGAGERWSEALLAMSYDDPDAAAGDGPRGREALAAGRPSRLRRLTDGDARAGLPRREPRTPGRRAPRARRRAGGARRRRARAAWRRAASSRSCVASRAVALELPGWARLRGARGGGRGARGRAGGRVLRAPCGAATRAGARRRAAATARAAAAAAPGRCTTATCAASSGEPPGRPPPSAGSCRSARCAEPGAAGLRLAAQRARRALGRRARRRSPSRRRPRSGTRRATSPGRRRAGCRPDVERAVAQVMTYIAQNEYAALYVPARFLPQVNPALRRGADVAREPRPRRGPPRRGVHQARARRRRRAATRSPPPSCRCTRCSTSATSAPPRCC